jgi:hypothetical protein
VAFGFTLNVIVRVVAVDAVTVPTAPLLKTTLLFPGIKEKPKPLIVIVAARIDRLAVLRVTTGVTLATCIAAPLDLPLVVTTAVRIPAVCGFVENVTSSEVAVAVVTVPTAPLLNVTVLFAATVLKPAPVIVIVESTAVMEVVATVTAGATVAICVAVPLVCELVVTIAVRVPSAIGFVENVTVSKLTVAEVTVPIAPLFMTTVLLAATGSNPEPEIVTVVALIARLVVLLVTTGVTVATWTAAPLTIPLVVTITVRLPAVFGLIENVTVISVNVADVTVPTAPLLKTTVLREATGSKSLPSMTTVVEFAARPAVLSVAAGIEAAT